MYVRVFVVVYIRISCNIGGNINTIPFFGEVFRNISDSSEFTKCNDVFKLSIGGISSTPDSSNMKENFLFRPNHGIMELGLIYYELRSALQGKRKTCSMFV